MSYLRPKEHKGRFKVLTPNGEEIGAAEKVRSYEDDLGHVHVEAGWIILHEGFEKVTSNKLSVHIVTPWSGGTLFGFKNCQMTEYHDANVTGQSMTFRPTKIGFWTMDELAGKKAKGKSRKKAQGSLF